MCWLREFFQEEGGIPDRDVTGVQTCALPSLAPRAHEEARVLLAQDRLAESVAGRAASRLEEGHVAADREREVLRSEERRVGKECRSRWSPYRENKKRNMRRVKREVCGRRLTH